MRAFNIIKLLAGTSLYGLSLFIYYSLVKWVLAAPDGGELLMGQRAPIAFLGVIWFAVTIAFLEIHDHGKSGVRAKISDAVAQALVSH